MKETLQEWKGTIIAIKTIHGDSFEGYLRNLKDGCVFVEVKDKGLFCCPLEVVCLAAKVSQVSVAKEIRVQ